MSFSAVTLEQRLREQLQTAISVSPRGVNDYRVEMPFSTADGDLLKIILSRQIDGTWRLSDEGHTLMFLSYYDININTTTREAFLDEVLGSHFMEKQEGVFTMKNIVEEDVVRSVFTFSQGLLKASDLALWRKERVASLFMEEFEEAVKIGVKGRPVEFNYYLTEHDPKKQYKIDGVITMKNGRPLHIYGVNSDVKAQSSMISMYYFERRKLRVPNCVVYSDDAALGKKTRGQVDDITDKTLSSPAAVSERLEPFIEKFEAA